MTARRQLRLPQFFARLDIKRAEEWIEGGGDEDQSTGRDDRTTEADRTWQDWRVLASKVLHRAERKLPANLSFVHVYSSEQAPWGRSAGQARRRLEEATKQAVRRTGLRRILAGFRAKIAPRKLCAGNELYFRDAIICINDQKTVLWIDSVAAPRHSAQVSWHDESTLKAWRREDAFVAKSFDPGEAGVAILLGRTPGVLRGYFLSSERWGRERKRLRG